MKQGTAFMLALCLVVFGLAWYAGTHQGSRLGGTTNFNDLSVDTLTSAGAISATAGTFTTGVTIGTGGTAVTSRVCGSTASYNAPSLATSATTTQDVAVVGAVAGDLCSASLLNATTTGPFQVSCRVTAAGTTTVDIVNLSGITVDLTTSTLKACITH
jgi:hypothetical protein